MTSYFKNCCRGQLSSPVPYILAYFPSLLPFLLLFAQITGNSQHLLSPPERVQHYSLRERSRNCQFPGPTSVINEKNLHHKNAVR